MVTFLAEKATFHRRDDDIATQLDVAVSTEDDVEVRRLAVTNHSDRPREIEVTSYAEIVLAPPADDLAHPAFGKLFVETEYLPESAALLCHRRPRAPDEAGAWAVHVLSLEGRTQGPVEWETDRARFLGRGRGPGESPGSRRALALRHHRGRARPHREPPAAHPPRAGRLHAAVLRHGNGALARDGSRARPALPRAERRGPHLRPRLRPRPERPPPPRHLRARRPCSSSASPRGCCTPTDRSARAPELLARNTLGQEGLWPHGISGDLPILLVRVVEEDDLPLVRQVLQAQEYWRLKGLSADVVILNEHPVSYLDEMHAQLAALLDNGPWRTWKHRPGGAYLLRGDRMPEAERILLASVARAVLSGERGELAEPARPARRRVAGAAGPRALRGAGRRRRGVRPRSPCLRSPSPTGSAASPTTGATT